MSQVRFWNSAAYMVAERDPCHKDKSFVSVTLSSLLSPNVVVNTSKKEFKLYKSCESFSIRGTNQERALLDKNAPTNRT